MNKSLASQKVLQKWRGLKDSKQSYRAWVLLFVCAPAELIGFPHMPLEFLPVQGGDSICPLRHLHRGRRVEGTVGPKHLGR